MRSRVSPGFPNTPCRPPRLSLEPLEPRLTPAPFAGQILLDGGTLTVEGTAGSDHILVASAGGPAAVRVFVDDRPVANFRGVQEIVVRAGAGDDTVRVGWRVTVPARLYGEGGDDHLRGGSGPDQLFGGDGDDRLVGFRSRDALDGGQGDNRVVVRESMGGIRVTPAAAGEATRILSGAYTLRRLGLGDAGTGPIVVAAANLDNPGVVAQLRAAYAAGQTVALAKATAADIERFRDLLGHRSGANPPADTPLVDLVAFRRSLRPDGRVHEQTELMLPRAAAEGSGSGQADELAFEWLSGVFSAVPVLPDPPPGDSPQQNLISIADSYQSTSLSQDGYGNQVQLTNLVWAARSFQNQVDLYYVLQEADYHVVFQIVESSGIYNLDSWNNSVASLLSEGRRPTLIQTSPSTTMEATQNTSTVGYTVGGSVGWNQAQGLNASVSGSVTVSNSKVTTIPPIDITNNSDLTTGLTLWTYDVIELPGNPETITLFDQWIWEVPFSAYAAGQESVQFNSEAKLEAEFRTGDPFNPTPLVANLDDGLASVVPLPFGDTFALQQPVVLSVSPTSVNSGDTFTITGTGLYPSLVTAVLIDGVAAQYSTVSDTEITVIAPEEFGFFLPVVVQTTQGVSNDTVTIEINDL